jgi:rod shape-determining protein MreC
MSSLKNFSINKKSNGAIKFIIGAVALLVLLFILNLFVTPLKNAFYAISSPIQKTFLSAGESSSSFLGSIFQAGSLAMENENLKLENQKLLTEVAALQTIEQGNQAQTAVSASCQNTGFKTVMAGVNGLDNDILSINKGSANGIAVGMPVINPQNVLFGKVLKVYKNYSQVMLISSKSSVVNIKVQKDITCTDPEIDGVVKGSSGLKGYLDLIAVSDNISSGDVLVTSSLDKSFPKDLLVGKITKVTKDDQKPFQQAQLDLSFDIKAADNLFIITNYKQQ